MECSYDSSASSCKSLRVCFLKSVFKFWYSAESATIILSSPIRFFLFIVSSLKFTFPFPDYYWILNYWLGDLLLLFLCRYLHETCQPPIMHRNFKSCNLLLNDDLFVQVSDCGLASIMPANSIAQVSSSDSLLGRWTDIHLKNVEYSLRTTYRHIVLS